MVPAARAFAVPGGPSRTAPPPSAPTGVLDLREAGIEPPPEPRRHRRGRTAALVILLLAVLLGVAGWYVGAGPGSKIATPNVVGKPTSAAQGIVEAKGLHTRVTEVFSETATAGTVAATDPAPGKAVGKHGTVVLDVSKGPERYPVPDVAGKPLDQAESALTGTKLAVGSVTQAYSDAVRKDAVISTDPAAGTRLAPDKPVNIVLSKGPAPVTLDDWTGKPAGVATQQLGADGLKVTTTSAYSTSVGHG